LPVKSGISILGGEADWALTTAIIATAMAADITVRRAKRLVIKGLGSAGAEVQLYTRPN
jgi:hypothetical protein